MRPSRPGQLRGSASQTSPRRWGRPEPGSGGVRGAQVPPPLLGPAPGVLSPRTLVLGTPASGVPAPWVPGPSVLGSLPVVRAAPLPLTHIPPALGCGVPTETCPPPSPLRVTPELRIQTTAKTVPGRWWQKCRGTWGRVQPCHKHAHTQQVPTAPQVPTGQGEPPDHGLGLARCWPGAVQCLALSPNPTTPPHTQALC